MSAEDRAARAIKDDEVNALAGIAAKLAPTYVDPERDPWAGSPFAWIRTRPSRQVGKIGEQLVADWAAAKGLRVSRTGDAEADRVIDGRRVEIKFSTLWAGGGYKFQQIRDQRYELLLCLGLSPFNASCWVIPKMDIQSALRGTSQLDGLTGQHTGAAAADTHWLSFHAERPPDWLRRYGGTLTEAYKILAMSPNGGR